jgi:hypothetical protein
MFNLVAGAVNNPASTGNNSVGSLLRTVATDHAEEEGNFIIYHHLFVIIYYPIK